MCWKTKHVTKCSRANSRFVSAIPVQEFDRDYKGFIPLSQVSSMCQRLLPDITRKELAHVNLMLSLSGSSQVQPHKRTEVMPCRETFSESFLYSLIRNVICVTPLLTL
jgi:hypothetical protein